MAPHPVRARPHSDAVRGQRAGGPAGRRVPAGPGREPTATQPGGGLPGATAAFDVAFDPQEEWTRAVGSHWGEERQSQALAAARRLGPRPDGATSASSRPAATDAYAPAPGRFYNRIFRSTQTYGEGIALKNGDRPGAGRQPRPAVPVAATSPTGSTSRTTTRRGRPRRCCSTATRWT